jgi:DNA-binding CsgD family transcriptional regulator
MTPDDGIVSGDAGEHEAATPPSSALGWLDRTEVCLRTGDLAGALEALAVVRSLVTLPVAGDLLLTPRERSLIGLLTEGCTNRQMAERLHLSEKTVRNQLSTLFAKIGVQRRSQAAVLGVQLGIEPPRG